MRASLEQLKQCHCLSMKWMNKTDAPLATVAYKIWCGVVIGDLGVFRTNVSKRNLVERIQVDITNKTSIVISFCSVDFGEHLFILVYNNLLHQWKENYANCKYIISIQLSWVHSLLKLNIELYHHQQNRLLSFLNLWVLGFQYSK